LKEAVKSISAQKPWKNSSGKVPLLFLQEQSKASTSKTAETVLPGKESKIYPN